MSERAATGRATIWVCLLVVVARSVAWQKAEYAHLQLTVGLAFHANPPVGAAGEGLITVVAAVALADASVGRAGLYVLVEKISRRSDDLRIGDDIY